MKAKELQTYIGHSCNQVLAGRSKTSYESIVNAPFADKLTAMRLGLGIVVLLLVDPDKNTINRIALSKTDFAQHALDMSQKRFKEIKIPLDFTDNIITRALSDNEPKLTTDWQNLFNPELSAKAARFNQAAAGIEGSWVYPLDSKPGGALIFSYFLLNAQSQKDKEKFMLEFSAQVSKWLVEQARAPLQTAAQHGNDHP